MNFYHDQTRNLLIYPGAPLPHVQQSIPEMRQLNGSYFAVPRTLRNSQVLRHWNYPVAPIITNQTYDFPRPPKIKQPYESQVLTANFLILHKRCFNLSDPGAGKTEGAIWAADFLMRLYPGTRALVIGPLSILESVWAARLQSMFLGRRSFEILHGNPEKRMSRLDKKPDFAIINHDGVGVGTKTRKKIEIGGLSKMLRDDPGIKIVIVDEASAYKEARTNRHYIGRQVFGFREYLWMMTGSPTPNSPVDAFGLAKMVNNAYGKSFTGFRRETMIPITDFKWVPQKDGYEKAAALLSPSIRFDIDEVWDAPPLTVQQRLVELTAEQRKQMLQLKNEMQVTMKSGAKVPVQNEAGARSKFLQISLGAVYDENHVAHKVDATPRINELKSVLAEFKGKWLCFVPFRSAINTLYEALREEHKVAMVHGDVSSNERTKIFAQFQGEGVDGILADPATMAHGLDLWAGKLTVWFGPSDKAELYDQANKRVHRPGQTGPVTVIQIVSNKLEQEIFRRLENNLSLQGALLDYCREAGL